MSQVRGRITGEEAMAQLQEDEWPADGEQTTIEKEVEVDPINGPKDPDRPLNREPEDGADEPAWHQRRG